MKDYKIVLVGDAAIGKTAILRNIKGCEFEKRYISTIGCELHPIVMKPSSAVSYTFWDTPGQEKYSDKFTNYFKNANLVVLVYDITSSNSYKNIGKWIELIKTTSSTIPIVLVGNKSDSTRKIQNPTFHIDNDIPYFEVSAKTGETMNTLIEYILYSCN